MHSMRLRSSMDRSCSLTPSPQSDRPLPRLTSMLRRSRSTERVLRVQRYRVTDAEAASRAARHEAHSERRLLVSEGAHQRLHDLEIALTRGGIRMSRETANLRSH